VSEPYRIRIPAAIDQQMAGWPISDELRAAALQHLRDTVGPNPATQLRPVIMPWGERLNLFSFRLPDTATLGAFHVFMFHMIYTDDETALIVMQCGYQHVRPLNGNGLPVQ
jgi:hypothetical protein